MEGKVQRNWTVVLEHGTTLCGLAERAEDVPQQRTGGDPDGVPLGPAGSGDRQLNPKAGRGAEGERFRTRGFSPRSL